MPRPLRSGVARTYRQVIGGTCRRPRHVPRRAGFDPVPWRRDHVATAATRRACPSTSRGTTRSLFDIGTGLRYFGCDAAAGRLVPRHLPADATSTGTTPRACRSSRRCCSPGAELDVYGPAQDDGRTRRRGVRRDDPPAAVPDRPRRVPRHVPVPRRRRRRVHDRRRRRSTSRFDPARRRRRSATASSGTVAQRRLHQRPPAALRRRLPRQRRRARARPRRRPADPRLAVHAGGVRPEVRRGATAPSSTRCGSPATAGREAAGAVPPRPDPHATTRSTRSASARRSAGRRWPASRSSPPREGLTVDLG